MLSCRFSPSAIILVISLGPAAMPSWNHLLVVEVQALSKRFDRIRNSMYGHSLINHKAERRYPLSETFTIHGRF